MEISIRDINEVPDSFEDVVRFLTSGEVDFSEFDLFKTEVEGLVHNTIDKRSVGIKNMSTGKQARYSEMDLGEDFESTPPQYYFLMVFRDSFYEIGYVGLSTLVNISGVDYYVNYNSSPLYSHLIYEAIENIGSSIVNPRKSIKYFAMDRNMLLKLYEGLFSQDTRSYLHLLNQRVGPENMTQMLPPELIDYIADQLYSGQTRQYPPVLTRR